MFSSSFNISLCAFIIKIILLGFRIISGIAKVSVCVICLSLDNSVYQVQPHPMIVNFSN